MLCYCCISRLTFSGGLSMKKYACHLIIFFVLAALNPPVTAETATGVVFHDTNIYFGNYFGNFIFKKVKCQIIYSDW